MAASPGAKLFHATSGSAGPVPQTAPVPARNAGASLFHGGAAAGDALSPTLNLPAAEKKGGSRGFLGSVARYSGVEFAGNLAKDVGATAVGVVPGIYDADKALVNDYRAFTSGKTPTHVLNEVVKPTVQGYKDYYGHDVLHHLYKDPLQPILDAATIADLGATAGVRAGLLTAGRGTVVTRSPRNIATGKGPANVDLTSVKPLVRGREQLAAKVRAANPEGIPLRPGGTPRVGGEVKRYGKQIQADATQHALGRLSHFDPYHRATRRLSSDEWTALHIRAMDIHPSDLAELWRGTSAESIATNPKIRALALEPSKRMLVAEPAARNLSKAGADLYRERKLLADETAAARPDLTRRQAAEMLGRPVKSITGNPYYFPHRVDEAQAVVSPLAASGGGKGVPRKLGSMKQNTGSLALHGKLHLRGDVLGPEFLRRVKYVKYDEIHNALVRGAIRVTAKEIDQNYGGKLPPGYEYVREKAGKRIPPTLRAEGDQRIPIDRLIPNAEDLHDSQLAKDGFSTGDPKTAHQSGGRYYIVPKSTVKAATGEFTRSSDFSRAFVKQPLAVWRALVLGLRPGFLTNNLIGNSLMYAARTTGSGALRDMIGAIKETHGPDVAKKAVDSAATPPDLRADLYREFFPEQTRGTFGRTQSPSTSKVGNAANKGTAAFRATTGAIPKVTSKVAEEMPRRALIRHFIRNSPEFKQVYRQLPKETKTFETAARRVLEGKGGAAYQRYISKQVNDALGNYLGLSAVERNVLRNAAPFYAWYKAITTTTWHLAADTPLRANILGQIGRIGREQSDQALGEVPSFLKGAIGLGAGKGGTNRVLATQGMNPYATLEQLRSGTTEDLTDLGINPFVIGGAQTLAKATQTGGHISPGRLVGSTLYSMGRSLPPARVIAPQPPSLLYPNRNRKSELSGYFGVPVKEYNPLVAAMQARKGR